MDRLLSIHNAMTTARHRERGRWYHATHKEQERAYRLSHKGERRAYLRDYYLAHKEIRWRRYKAALYGLTPEVYNRMLEEQGGVCAICSQPEPRCQGLSVDHDHNTGVVRGLLCSNCNTALGLFIDDPDRLARAATYLKH